MRVVRARHGRSRVAEPPHVDVRRVAAGRAADRIPPEGYRVEYPERLARVRCGAHVRVAEASDVAVQVVGGVDAHRVGAARPVGDRPIWAGRRDVQPQADGVAVVVVDEDVAAKVPVAVRNLAGRLVGDRMPEHLERARRSAVGQADGRARLGADRVVGLGGAQPAVRERLAVVNVGRVGKGGRRAARDGRRRLRRSAARGQGGVLCKQPVAVPLRQEPGVLGQPLRRIRRGGNHPLEVRRKVADGRDAGVGMRPPAALRRLRLGKGGGDGKGKGKQRGNGGQAVCNAGAQRARRGAGGIKRLGRAGGNA